MLKSGQFNTQKHALYASVFFSSLLLLSACANAPKSGESSTAAASQEIEVVEVVQADDAAPAAADTEATTETAAEETVAENAGEATTEVTADEPIDILTIGKLIQGNRYHLYDSKTKTYTFYAGGVVFARFDPSAPNLTLKDDQGASDKLECTFNNDASVAAKRGAAAGSAEDEATCRHLSAKLEAILQ